MVDEDKARGAAPDERIFGDKDESKDCMLTGIKRFGVSTACADRCGGMQYYLPFELRPEDKDRLESRKKHIEAQIEREERELRERHEKEEESEEKG